MDVEPFALPSGIGRHVEEVRIGDAILGYKAVRQRLRRCKWDHSLGRIYDIERLIRARHGDAVPETDDAETYAEAIAAIFFVQFDEDEYVQTRWVGVCVGTLGRTGTT